MPHIPVGTRVKWMDRDLGPMSGKVAVFYDAIDTYAVDGPPLGRSLIPTDVLHSANPKAVVGEYPIQRL